MDDSFLTACSCSTLGSVSTREDCNPIDGKCACLEGHTGRECNNCTFGYTKNEHGHCSGIYNISVEKSVY